MRRRGLCMLGVCIVVLGPAWLGCAGPLQLWDVRGQRTLTVREALPKLMAADVVTVGEIHDRPSDHLAQLTILRALHEEGQRFAVGLEMFQQRNQAELDQWIAGQTSESELEQRFSLNWGMTWPLYLDIFLYCRESGIPMVGLNVPREITSKVASEGFASLTPAEVGLLPPITCKIGKEYADIMRRAHGHAGMGEAAFTRFCEAQLVWDAAMAVYSEEYLKASPGTRLIILAGAVHAWREGIPAQLRSLNPARRTVVILPESDERFRREDATIDDSDYLMLGP